MNVVLIGYRGSGKSVVSKILAKRLQMPCVVMDKEIVKKAGMSIPEIVQKYGWQKFRNIESEQVKEIAGLDNIVIDTGGGVIERPENVQVLKANSHIFWLKASTDTIVSRIQEDTERPALSQGKTFIEEVREVLERRIPEYKRASQYEIDTDELTPDQIADRIIETLKENQA